MNSWISAARPRTLPLALASIFLGSFLAAASNKFDSTIFTLCCLTTISLQILSNFANDYGDTQNGADSVERVGPQRAVQSGAITPNQMWRAILLFGGLSLLFGIALLYVVFRDASSSQFLTFLGIGIACILAAYFYTAGKNPYGYAGLGDVSVLIFFGLVGVLGSYYLYTKTIDKSVILPALSCGLFATGVLNINNIRDISSDMKAGKRTIPTRLGKQKAQIYHWVLLLGGMITALVYTSQTPNQSYWYVVTFPLFIINGIKVSKLPNPDPLLKQMSLSTLAFVLAFGISFFVK